MNTVRHAAGQPGPGGFGAGGGGFVPPGGGFVPPGGGFVPPGGGFVPPGGGYQYQPPPPPIQTSTGAIVALVCGILTFMTTCFPLGFVALYLGAKARREAQERGEPKGTANDVLGLVGMIVGGIFGGLWLLFWLFEVAMIVLGVGVPILMVLFQ